MIAAHDQIKGPALTPDAGISFIRLNSMSVNYWSRSAAVRSSSTPLQATRLNSQRSFIGCRNKRMPSGRGVRPGGYAR